MRKSALLAALPLCLAIGCEASETEENDFTSAEATLLTFTFSGSFVTTQTWNLEQTAQDQLLFTIGHLNGNRSVGRLDTTKITNIKSERLDGGLTQVTYDAVMPVGWGSKTNLPTSYELVLPKRVDSEGQTAFAEKYGHTCIDSGAHDVDSSSMWYYYRPKASRCTLDEADVVRFTATVEKSAENTEGKFPEYDKVWEDDELSVVAIFGKYEDGATTSSDAGVDAFGRFVSGIRNAYKTNVTTPADVPARPGVATPDVTIEATLPNGKKLKVTALLVDNVSSAPETFYQRYEGLSTEADLLFYNGHAGLGQNVRALARRGKFRAGKYQIFFMNGCDTFAYVDGSLAKTRSVVNPDDPGGTKYLDMVTNVMPSFFSSMPNASLAMIKGLASVEAPKTYQEIFKDIDRAEVVVVTGEEDNAFTPGGVVEPWTWADKGAVARGASVEFSLGVLQPGDYVINLREDQASPGGDADLYVGLGKKPNATTYDFRPWLDGSNEEVRFSLTSATEVNLMVEGYESASQETSAFTVSAGVATH